VRPRFLASIAIFALVASACDRRPHPWDQPDAAASAAIPGPPATARLVEGDADAAPGEPLASQAPEPAAPPVRVGGPWVRCYGGFHPEGDPVKDVTRLSILCGPENGMKRLSKQPFEGTVAAGGPPVSQGFEARRGECYRVFAVAEPTVQDLDVVVRSSRGAPLAADHGEDAWPIVQPDRPFCPLEDDRYAVEVSAKRGGGRFAAEVWVLRTSGPK
jgi:hypothetical protein